jgi:paraquat-inducible protein A
MITNRELDQFIICKKCDTLHRKIPLHQGTKALCSKCDTLIYRRDDKMIEKSLALVITTIISLIVAFEFTIISININGLEQSLSLSSLFAVLIEHNQYVVGIMFLFLIVIFPLMILTSLFFIFFFMKIKKYGYTTKRLLILLSHLKHWSMVDIFFISLLVAMVKLFDYARIEIGVSFVAFILTLILELIITKNISFHELWQEHENIYGEEDDDEEE